MRRNYSRLASVEEGKNMRKAYVFGISTIIIIVLLIIFGVPAVSKLAGYIFDMKKSTITSQDTTPPGPPFLKSVPEATNKSELKLEGNSEPGVTVEIFVNDEKTETTADDNGDFTSEVTLAKGSNLVHAKAKDKGGNESVDSKQFTVYFSNEKPKLEVTKPSPGDKYYGDNQRQLSVQGVTCADCSLTVNGRIALVEDDGNFKLTYSLNDGNNDLNIVTTDKSGNHEETTISVEFIP